MAKGKLRAWWDSLLITHYINWVDKIKNAIFIRKFIQMKSPNRIKSLPKQTPGVRGKNQRRTTY